MNGGCGPCVTCFVTFMSSIDVLYLCPLYWDLWRELPISQHGCWSSGFPEVFPGRRNTWVISKSPLLGEQWNDSDPQFSDLGFHWAIFTLEEWVDLLERACRPGQAAHTGGSDPALGMGTDLTSTGMGPSGPAWAWEPCPLPGDD